MIECELIRINTPNDFFKLKQKIKGTHIDNETINELVHFLGNKCDMVRIENPYSDKDYLSNYYIHYSKKYRDYDKKCYRIHLYSKESYLGFIILRPTCHRKIGRSYIHPSLLLDKSAYLMASDFKANILGNRNEVTAFPWMHQEPDVTCCAHITLWSILRYFSSKYSDYSDPTIADIVNKIQYNYDRKIPTKGLREEQISNLLIQFGFSTLIRSNHVNDEIFTYIESGLPVIGIIPTDNDEAHAICLIGHGDVKRDDSFEPLKEIFKTKNKKGELKSINTDIILSTKFLDSLIVNDDNYFPYRTVYKQVKMLEKIDKKYEPVYIVDNIKSFIIPLYEKMQITYNEVYNIVLNYLLSNSLSGLPSPKVLRFFITSSNSFKENLKSRNINSELRRILLRVNMPKFIWCVEISSRENYVNGLIDGCIIIDATDSSEEMSPFIVVHDREKVEYYNGNRNLKNKIDILPYKQYINNLKEFNYE